MDLPRVTLENFMENMYYQTTAKPLFVGDDWLKKRGKPPWTDMYWERWLYWAKAPFMPIFNAFEVGTPEPMFYAVADGLNGTAGLWWDYTKVREGISISPMAQAHGTVLMKQSYQRKDAKEMIATVQTLKTVLLNLESDLEKIKEQKKAFDSKNEEQIKGIFVDNYGGPTRSWTSMARAVPLVKTALTWFYRCDEKSSKGQMDQVDGFVKGGELNPAVANYLKRKVEEFWNWRDSYGTFIQRTYSNILENIRQQRANLQLYMRWATRNIQEAENMLIPYEEMRAHGDVLNEEFPQFGGKLYTVTEMFHEGWKWGFIKDLCKPWHPAIATTLVFAYNPDLPQYKFCRGALTHTYGSIRHNDLKSLQEKLKKQNDDFIEVMQAYGGYTDEQLGAMGIKPTEEEKEMEKYHDLKGKEDQLSEADKAEMKKLGEKIGMEIAEKGEEPAESEQSLTKELKEAFAGFKPKSGGSRSASWSDTVDNFSTALVDNLRPIFYMFGSDFVDKLDTRQKRSDWIAQTSFNKFYHRLKQANSWLDWED